MSEYGCKGRTWKLVDGKRVWYSINTNNKLGEV